MKVQDIMTREVQTCRPEDTLSEAARRMWEYDCGCIVVVDGSDAIAGILTDRDACMCTFFENARPNDLTVEHAMGHQVVTCRDSDDLGRALELMSTHEVRRLPVLDQDQNLAGLISINDLVRAAARESEPEPEVFVEALAYICTPRSREYVCVVGATGAESVPLPEGEFVAQR